MSLNLAWFADVTGASKGQSLRASAYKQFVNTSSWDVGAYVSAERTNAKVVNYYFGVPASEVTAARALHAGCSDTVKRGLVCGVEIHATLLAADGRATVTLGQCCRE